MTASASAQLSEKRIKRLKATVMNPVQSLEIRLSALKRIYADRLNDRGQIERNFCVWDPIGRNGPILSTVNDQKLRSMAYGLVLNTSVYQDENQLRDDLRSGRCDLALMRGHQIHEFNRFTATLEAPGGVPSVRHMQILNQVLSSPKMAGRMIEGEYVIAGIAYLGESYLFQRHASNNRFDTFKNKVLGASKDQPALGLVARTLSNKVKVMETSDMAQAFLEDQSDGMFSSLVSYYALMQGKINGPVKLMNMSQSIDTLQIVARLERVPSEMSQLMREDMALKFRHYVKQVDKEKKNIPAQYWMPLSVKQVRQQSERLQSVRLALKKQGKYDPYMLKLLRKVRCKLNKHAQECVNPVE